MWSIWLLSYFYTTTLQGHGSCSLVHGCGRVLCCVKIAWQLSKHCVRGRWLDARSKSRSDRRDRILAVRRAWKRRTLCRSFRQPQYGNDCRNAAFVGGLIGLSSHYGQASSGASGMILWVACGQTHLALLRILYTVLSFLRSKS